MRISVEIDKTQYIKKETIMIKIYTYLNIMINDRRVALDLFRTENGGFRLCLNIYLRNCLMSSCVIPVTLIDGFFKLYINPEEKHEVDFEKIHSNLYVKEEDEEVILNIESPEYTGVITLKNFSHGYF